VPFKVVCRKCGYVIHRSSEPPPLGQILNKLRRCPNCGKRLRFDKYNSIVINVKERRFMSPAPE